MIEQEDKLIIKLKFRKSAVWSYDEYVYYHSVLNQRGYQVLKDRREKCKAQTAGNTFFTLYNLFQSFLKKRSYKMHMMMS